MDLPEWYWDQSMPCKHMFLCLVSFNIYTCFLYYFIIFKFFSFFYIYILISFYFIIFNSFL